MAGETVGPLGMLAVLRAYGAARHGQILRDETRNSRCLFFPQATTNTRDEQYSQQKIILRQISPNWPVRDVGTRAAAPACPRPVRICQCV